MIAVTSPEIGLSTSHPPSSYDSFARLTDEEMYWRDHQVFLEAQGYMLRHRYQPDWTPSWRGKRPQDALKAEDAFALKLRTSVIDATRISDGTLVYIKRTRTDSQELQIVAYLNSDELRQDPRNHCIPLLDVLQDPSAPDTSFMVMPFLRYIDSPPMERVEDVLDCFDQVLEGLVFIHDHGVAHRDCAYKNVMMDAAALFPRGFHPVLQLSLPDISSDAPVLSRAAVPINYYYIDFGISTRFTPDSPSKLVVGSWGLDWEPPELSETVPYDPFKLDVFLIGNLMRRQFCDKYFNLTMLEPLMNQMVDQDPARRPTAAEAYQQYTAIRRSVSSITRYWSLQPRDSFLLGRAFRHTYSLFYAIYRSIF
ncbi:uncharacterized protein TRAVEDRAFT_44951 [Trametes versicolor FP-101664 SS1]|uniref:uncharacterized protein n=1 Tax=Trametes versicolor (strain FP-101664) TaxID=717944 RepID=UPI00046225D1|nr:uncharacterized protein TRAVEDRAFT_44951 [Trametes versicolor FP-101664 SS1]EIW62121.1 hypothetical protein TRAVEDRAFT_44951 [Trametes versicolor FP-101664 SS1]